MDKQYCPNCGAKLPAVNSKVQTKWRSPKSWLSNKKLFIKLGVILVVIVGLLSLEGVMKNSTYLFHASVSRKIQISYQDVNHHTVLNEYYDIRNNNRNYANYFGGKSSYWHRQRNFKSTAYFYGSGRSGYNRLWKNYHGKYAARYKMEQKIQEGGKNTILIDRPDQASIKMISDEKNSMKFLDQYSDRGRCIYPYNREIHYYRLNTLTQY